MSNASSASPKPKKHRLRTLLASLTIAIGLAIIILFIKFQKNNGRRARRYCSLFFPICGFKLDKRGEYDLSADLIVVNHQSLVDIICLEGDHPRNICWVAKKELGDMFLYGHALKAPKMILIDREDKKGLLTLLKVAKEKVAEGRPLVIFPEGTRGKGEANLLPFKPGAKMLAEKLGLKVQPIILLNTKKVYNPSTFSSLTDTVRMVIMPSFTPVAGTNWYEDLEKDMTKEYQKNYYELNGKPNSSNS
ncbi:lysophospholipid acyltransferase family protein [Helicobacter sp. 11S02629-2]|uniref:lysophospholipid acyltransferase family protein n=1 Tax=Helicobacter sp. 11S02629-2 TaxID=1476195 RepID=UPI000BA6D91E|nr:lysophospholipid acyltransferase family protein [Helicobacter sp. 11S02629-2]PAF42892.1 1-acyl-sn-glycerol-3-phosphate acyltransferase [Helicobacter sp. 11S02629-2]